ncbi:unnamed protein product, partial [Allacma fusca]
MNQRNPSALRTLITTTENSISSIKSLGVATRDWDPMIVRLVTRKLDATTNLRFHQSLPDKNLPSQKILFDFLNKEVMNLATTVESTHQQPKLNPETKNPDRVYTKPRTALQLTCDLCKSDHPNYRCPKILDA